LREGGDEQGTVSRGETGSPKDSDRIVEFETRDMDKALRKITVGKGGRDEQRKGTSPVPSVHGLDRTRTETGRDQGPEGQETKWQSEDGKPVREKVVRCAESKGDQRTN